MLSKARKDNFMIILKNTPQIGKAIKSLFKFILNQKGPGRKHIQKLKKHRDFIRKIAHGPQKELIPTIVQHSDSIFKTILSVALPLLRSMI